MKSLLVFLFCLMAAIPAETRPHHGGVANGAVAGCAYATDNGCLLADTNGSFKDVTLLTSAQQSGQNSLLPTHPMTFNIPGVDYPISYNKTLTLKDPRTINDSVCKWAATFLDCSSTGSGVVNEVLDGYDFSGTTIGQSAAGIWAPNNSISAGSTLTITNSKFALIPSAVAEVNISGNFSNLVFKNNLCDGTNANSASGFCIDSNSTLSGSMDIEYNAFTNQGVGRIAGGLTNNSFTVKYNFIQGLNDLATTNHGELMERNCVGGRANCSAFDYYEGNFIVWNPPPSSGLDNTTFFPSDGASDGVAFTSVGIVNNIVVANKGAGAITGPDVGLMTVNQVSTLGNVTITGNWLDASGTGSGCNIIGDKSSQGTGMTAQQTGTVINITSIPTGFGNNPIEAGWQFWRGGVSVATVTSRGTGTGNTGTYNVNTSASIGPDTLWTLVPGWTSLTQSGNYNLNDPSHTGTPTAMTISGPAMIASPCVQ